MGHQHIDWLPKYDLGIEDIDFQHHYFLNLINRLVNDLDNNAKPAYQEAMIAELNAYARFHFVSEENMMMRADYPRLDEHKSHHRDLLDQLSIKQTKLLMNNSEQEINEIIDFLVGWFIQHTSCEDRLFAEFLQNKSTSPVKS